MSENQIIVYQPDETVRLDVRLENETVWLTQLKIAELFGVQKAAISKHVRNIFASGELVKNATVSKMETVQVEGGRSVVRTQEFFNLDVIIAVGYRVNSQRATQFRIWATKILKEYLLRGYSVNARLNQLEDTMHSNLAKHDNRITALEDKVEFFVKTKEPPLHGVFFQGQFWDAKSLLIKFIRRAKKELIVIDAYVGVATLDMLAKRGRGVKVKLITHSNGELEESDFEAFGKQFGKFTKSICGICHDRFIIVDNCEIYSIGASLKDAGRLTFGVSKMGVQVIPGLLDSIRKATTESREYGTGGIQGAKVVKTPRKRDRRSKNKGDMIDTPQLNGTQRFQASRILDDCQRTLDLLEDVPEGDKQLFRIYWTSCLVSLRHVQDIFEKYDIETFPAMRRPYERRKTELADLKQRYHSDTPFKDCPLDYLIYHRLIHGDREIAVSETEQSYPGTWLLYGPNESLDLGDLYLPMGNVDFWGDWDCRDWLSEAIDWWRKEIATYTKDCSITA